MRRSCKMDKKEVKIWAASLLCLSIFSSGILFVGCKEPCQTNGTPSAPPITATIWCDNYYLPGGIKATGPIHSNSGTITFTDASTGKIVEIHGNYIIRYE